MNAPSSLSRRLDKRLDAAAKELLQNRQERSQARRAPVERPSRCEAGTSGAQVHVSTGRLLEILQTQKVQQAR